MGTSNKVYGILPEENTSADIISFKNACENETFIQDLFSRAELD
jgi:hypothetical protein